MSDNPVVLMRPNILQPSTGTFLKPGEPLVLLFSPLMTRPAEGVDVLTLQGEDIEQQAGIRDFSGNLVPPFN